jgi:UDP-GlcNAc:undecaprenyl-phosphate GlcNAc-1-phosphate transferase
MIDYKIPFLLLPATAFIFSLFLIAFLRKLSLKFNILAVGNSTPHIGGIGFLLPFIICYILLSDMAGIIIPFYIIRIIIFSLALLLIGFIDDLREFSLKVKVTVQIILIFLFLLHGKKVQIYFLPFSINYLISFLWIMGVSNAFNHLDVADGLCGGVSLIIGLTFLAIFASIDKALALMLVTLSGTLLAFNIFNYPPAKVFMGNAGSHFLGFLFAAIAMEGDYATLDNVAALFLPILVLSLPLIDTAYLIIIRIKKNILPLRKSNDHIVLRYLSKGYSYRKSLFSLYAIASSWCLSGLLILNGVNIGFFISLVTAILGTILMIIKANLPKTSCCQS